MGDKKRQKKLSEQLRKSDHLLLELVAEIERFKKLVSALGNATPLAQQIKIASDLRKSAGALSDKAKAVEKSLEKQQKLEDELPEKPEKKAIAKPVNAAAKREQPKTEGRKLKAKS